MLRDLSTRQIVNVTSLPAATDNVGTFIRYNDTLMYSDGAGWRFVWHGGADGAGSGLDADFLDGKHASAFAQADLRGSYQVTSGTAPNYAITPSPALTALSAGVRYTLKIHAASSAAVSINVNALGAKALKKISGSALVAVTTLPANAILDVVYNGTDWVIPNVGL